MTIPDRSVVHVRSETELIEFIIGEVIRRLTAGGHVVARAPGTNGPAANAELRLDSRLVTLATVDGRLSGVARVIVPVRSVVTPAVSDELKRRNIQLLKG